LLLLRKKTRHLKAEVRIPAVAIRKSISAEFLICLEYGKQLSLCDATLEVA
jgi:predicted transcriptional regulator